jgi:hypothetical protein
LADKVALEIGEKIVVNGNADESVIQFEVNAPLGPSV